MIQLDHQTSVQPKSTHQPAITNEEPVVLSVSQRLGHCFESFVATDFVGLCQIDCFVFVSLAKLFPREADCFCDCCMPHDERQQFFGRRVYVENALLADL